MNELITSVTTVVLAITGVAILAVIVSKNANTVAVLGAGSSAYSGALATALSPITGGGSGTFNFGGGASYLS